MAERQPFLDSFLQQAPEGAAQTGMTGEQFLNTVLSMIQTNPLAERGVRPSGSELAQLFSGEQDLGEYIKTRSPASMSEFKPSDHTKYGATGASMAAGIGASAAAGSAYGGAVGLAIPVGMLAAKGLDKVTGRDKPFIQRPFSLEEKLENEHLYEKQIPGWSGLSRDEKAKIIALTELAGYGSYRGPAYPKKDDEGNIRLAVPDRRAPATFFDAPGVRPRVGTMDEEAQDWEYRQGMSKNLLEQSAPYSTSKDERERFQAWQKGVSDIINNRGGYVDQITAQPDPTQEMNARAASMPVPQSATMPTSAPPQAPNSPIGTRPLTVSGPPTIPTGYDPSKPFWGSSTPFPQGTLEKPASAAGLQPMPRPTPGQESGRPLMPIEIALMQKGTGYVPPPGTIQSTLGVSDMMPMERPSPQAIASLMAKNPGGAVNSTVGAAGGTPQSIASGIAGAQPAVRPAQGSLDEQSFQSMLEAALNDPNGFITTMRNNANAR